MNELFSFSLRRPLPLLITFGSLISGFSAVLLVGYEELTKAAICIVVSNLLDGLDGALARRLGVASDFGLQLDSLVDVVTFGIAPSILVYQYMRHQAFSPVVMWVVCAAYLIGGVFRLARFNLLPPKKSHSDNMGLTISIAGGTVALTVLSYLAYDHRLIPPVFLPVLMVFLTLLMVSRIRYPGLAPILRRRWLSLPGLGVLAVLSIWISPQLAWLGVAGCYVSFGLVRAAYDLIR